MIDAHDRQALGAYLRQAREAKGYSRHMVILMAKAEQGYSISPGYLADLEHGRGGSPYPKLLRCLAALYGLDWQDLMRRASYEDSFIQSILERETPSFVRVQMTAPTTNIHRERPGLREAELPLPEVGGIYRLVYDEQKPTLFHLHSDDDAMLRLGGITEWTLENCFEVLL